MSGGYKKGETFVCPYCEQESIVRSETEMDGWKKVGEFLSCAMCGKKLSDVVTSSSLDIDEATGDDKGNRDLMDFLGTSKDVKKKIVDDDGTRRFCRDCSSLMDHPFKTYCLRHKIDVNPMDDCDDFSRKSDL